IGTGTTTTVAGNGDCDPRARADGVPATQGAMGTIEALTSFHGGLLAGEFSSYQGTPSVIRFIDRLSFVSAPPPVFSPFRSLAISFEALDGNDSVWCALDAARSGGFTDPNCQSPFEQSNLADDNYSLRLSVDTVDSMPDIYPWTVDGTAPGAPVPTDPAPDGLVASARPLLKWTAAEDPAPPYFGQPMFGSGVDHYELLIDGKKDTDGACCETQPATALGEGSHTWQLRAVDRAGNTTAGETRTLRYGSPPVAALTISPNPALAGAVLTLNASTSSDAEGPIARYEFDLDNDGNYERDAGSSPTTTASFADPGTFTVGVRVTDGVANTATAKADVKVNAPLAAANLFGATINNGAQYTRDPNVVVSVKYPATISGLILSNDGGFLAPATFAAQKDVKWKLDSSGPERLPKIVYVRFQTGPIVSETYTDDIILDEIPPLVQKASVAPSAAGASIAKLRKYVVKVKATDSNSGVAKVQITRSKKKPGKLIAYTTKLTVRSAGRPKYLRAQDRAGNFSAWKKLR
ncbi:MAG: hypothetical protein QOJ29_130, partial [Thermoleophilaceae bacterium]|nr:hypothetical protein [Thermoleophilaceae bacterium]